MNTPRYNRFSDLTDQQISDAERAAYAADDQFLADALAEILRVRDHANRMMVRLDEYAASVPRLMEGLDDITGEYFQ